MGPCMLTPSHDSLGRSLLEILQQILNRKDLLIRLLCSKKQLKRTFKQRTKEEVLAAHLTKSSSDDIITNLPPTRLATGSNKWPFLYCVCVGSLKKKTATTVLTSCPHTIPSTGHEILIQNLQQKKAFLSQKYRKKSYLLHWLWLGNQSPWTSAIWLVSIMADLCSCEWGQLHKLHTWQSEGW